jgi:inner membrane protein
MAHKRVFAALPESFMPSVISHAVVAAALITAFPAPAVSRRSLLLGIACTMAPDVDVLGFRFGIKYGDFLGHRGFTHSLVFAAILATVAIAAAASGFGPRQNRRLTWLYFFLATASHGILDAFTDGGLGVALFSPFDTTRYFFAWTPIEVSPIGVRFISARGAAVFLSELQWVWLPSAIFAAGALFLRRCFSRTAPTPNEGR